MQRGRRRPHDDDEQLVIDDDVECLVHHDGQPVGHDIGHHRSGQAPARSYGAHA
jgi:hypothetical protein